MDWFTGIAIYLTLWWVVLFCVLPIGARSQAEAGEVTPGTEPGAPVAPRMGRKLIWTSVAAAVLWAVLAALIGLNLVSLEHPLGRLAG